MKKRLRKNQIAITSLAIMIAIAGYLNFTNVDVFEEASVSPVKMDTVSSIDTMDISDGDSLISEKVDDEVAEEENEEDKNKAGEAVLTQANVQEYVAGARLDREQNHSKTKESLNDIINNDSVEEESKKEAVEELTKLTKIIEYETSIEQLLASKGFENAVVSIGDNTIDVILNFEELSQSQRAQIEDIITRKTGYSISQIVISQMQATKS